MKSTYISFFGNIRYSEKRVFEDNTPVMPSGWNRMEIFHNESQGAELWVDPQGGMSLLEWEFVEYRDFESQVWFEEVQTLYLDVTRLSTGAVPIEILPEIPVVSE